MLNFSKLTVFVKFNQTKLDLVMINGLILTYSLKTNLS